MDIFYTELVPRIIEEWPLFSENKSSSINQILIKDHKLNTISIYAYNLTFTYYIYNPNNNNKIQIHIVQQYEKLYPGHTLLTQYNLIKPLDSSHKFISVVQTIDQALALTRIILHRLQINYKNYSYSEDIRTLTPVKYKPNNYNMNLSIML